MTLTELEDLLTSHGWYLYMSVRRGRGKRFAYAKKRQGQAVYTRYLKAESKLSQLTEEGVLGRLTL